MSKEKGITAIELYLSATERLRGFMSSPRNGRLSQLADVGFRINPLRMMKQFRKIYLRKCQFSALVEKVDYGRKHGSAND